MHVFNVFYTDAAVFTNSRPKDAIKESGIIIKVWKRYCVCMTVMKTICVCA